MAIYDILQYPNPRLKQKAAPVTDFGDELQTIIDNMFETHYSQENCAALAASQLDMENPPHVTVIDFSFNKDEPLCLVNAKIVESEGTHSSEEGCMSVGLGGNIGATVKRAEKIKVEAQDRHGKALHFSADGFMAKCIQHELDHLDGKLYIDHLSSLKRSRLEKQLDKFRRWKKSFEKSKAAEDKEDS